MKNLFLVLILLIATISSAQEEINYNKLGMEVKKDQAPTGLKVGDEAPRFSKEDQHGSLLNLDTLLKDGPVVLLFYRGHWCPLCNRYLAKFQEELSALRQKGARIIAVTPQEKIYVDETIEKNELDISVLSDLDLSIINSYDVGFAVTEKYQEKIRKFKNVDIAETRSAEEAVLPVPATYVIGQDGKIKFVHFDINYKSRASVGDILPYIE